MAKIQLIKICIASTSFTKLQAEQKLWKFAEEDLLGKWSWILSWGNDLDSKECPKILRAIKNIKIALPSQSAVLNRIEKWILLNYFWTRQGRFLTYLTKIWPKEFMRFLWEFWEWQKYRLLHNLGQKLTHGHDT